MNQTSAHQDRPITGLAIRLFAIATLACMFALVKYVGEQDVHVIEVLFYRFLFGTIVTGAWIISRKGGLTNLKSTRYGAHLARAILGIIAMGANFLAVMLLPMAEAATIGFTVPMIATIFSVIFLSEFVGIRRWIAVLVGFSGIVIAMQPWHNEIPLLGAAVAMTGAIFGAATTIIIRKLATTESAASIVFTYTLLGVPITGIAMIWVGQMHSLEVFGLLIAISILGTVGQLALSESLRLANIAVVMPMDYSNLIFATALGYVFWDQIPSPTLWLGTPLIIGSGIYIALRERKLSIQRAMHPENPSPVPKG